MSFKKIKTLTGFIILMVITTLIAYAQEPVTVPADSASLSSDPQIAPKSINETQWAWGEVINLDAQAKTLTLKYLDYETDQEKDLVLTVDEKTTFENIKSFDEIKIKDTLSIDYVVDVSGKNVAKNINFEKPDSTATAVAPVAESAKPAEVAEQPVADTSAQVAAPAQIPAPAMIAVPEVTQPTAQPATTTEASAPATEAVQPESTPVPAVQQSQTY